MHKILVVDDDQSILDAMKIALELQGYEVETTPKGEETFTKIGAFKPDLIFMDVYLSGMEEKFVNKLRKTKKQTISL